MAGYDLDEYEDYEDEGEDQEEEVGEDEEEEEEDRFPSKDELEYLELRQKLKESHRKKMHKKDPGSSHANLQDRKSKMPYDNFGSFFGPSQPVIAQRVIQESKSLLENPHLVERVSKPKNGQNKGASSNPVGSKSRSNGQPQKVDNWAKPKAKIEMLKNTRDYSFLLSDDADLPVPTKNPPKSVSAAKPEAHVSPRPPSNSGRKVINGREERRPLPVSSQMRVKAGPPSQRPGTASKVTSTSLDSRKQLGRNEGSGPGRPSGPKALPPKMSMASKQKAILPSVAKGSIPGGHKPLLSRPLPATHKKPFEHKKDDRGTEHRRDDRRDDRGFEHRRDDRGFEHRRDDRGSEHRRDDRGSDHRRDDRGSIKGNMIRKPVVSSKPQNRQIKQQPAKLPSSAQQKERPHKRPVRSYDDDDDDEGDKAISMIRNMFGYNPNRYHGVNDDDDSDMEAGFEDIMQEEKYSARIAAKEDEEELKKIEEEERRERMRRAAKKRKLGKR